MTGTQDDSETPRLPSYCDPFTITEDDARRLREPHSGSLVELAMLERIGETILALIRVRDQLIRYQEWCELQLLREEQLATALLDAHESPLALRLAQELRAHGRRDRPHDPRIPQLPDSEE